MDSQKQLGHFRRGGAVVIRDLQECLPLTNILGEEDLLYLVTPVAIPAIPAVPGSPVEDPFETLGKALSEHHRRIRHLPYTAYDGITQYHADHLSLAKAVIFVISGPPRDGQISQLDLFEFVRQASPHQPHIVIVCCGLDLFPSPILNDYPTLVQAQDYSPGRLEHAADLLFSPPPAPMRVSGSSRPEWLVEETDMLGADSREVHYLWCRCVPARFRIDYARWQDLINRRGYSKHFIVVDRQSNRMLGFCLTFTTFIGKENDCVGSIGAIFVQPEDRGQGIGTALHHHALRKLTERNICSRLQLGTTFPRILSGIPFEMGCEEWFRRRGWRIDDSGAPGSGQEVCDWVLDFSDWRASGLSDGGLTFRPCEWQWDYPKVIQFVEQEFEGKDYAGWYDQYNLVTQANVQNVLLVLEGQQIVATAITYLPRSDSQAERDLPWARTISDRVGGVTCICITDRYLSAAHTRDSVMIRLMNYCVVTLEAAGMEKMFLDGVRGGAEGFQAIGFKKWSSYREVWRRV